MKEAADLKTGLSMWNWQTNITDTTKSIYKEAAAASSKLSKELKQEAQKVDLNQIQDAEVKRKIKSFRSLSTGALSPTKLSQFLNVTSSMGDIFRYVHIVYIVKLVQITTGETTNI